MSNHFYHLLAAWLPRKDQANWVLGAIVNTRGSVYRKTGALMLLSDEGDQLGLLSGGCLESDLLLQARKVVALGKSRRVVYDASDDGNIAWRLGIGCGGRAEIQLHPCHAGNDYLQLPAVFDCLSQQQACRLTLNLIEPQAHLSPSARDFRQRQHGQMTVLGESEELTTLINPLPHLLLLGQGIDLIPLCQLALILGWRVTLADKRLSPAKHAHFPAGTRLLTQSAADFPGEFWAQVDAVVVAHHNIALDAEALAVVQGQTLTRPYLGLLGPAQRKAEVLAQANLREANLLYPVAGPMGLALGGDLPESIALSVLAECHAHLFGSNAEPLSFLAALANSNSMASIAGRVSPEAEA